MTLTCLWIPLVSTTSVEERTVTATCTARPCEKVLSFNPNRSDLLGGEDHASRLDTHDWVQRLFTCVEDLGRGRRAAAEDLCSLAGNSSMVEDCVQWSTELHESIATPKVSRVFPEDDPILVVIDNVVTEHESEALHDLARCVQLLDSDQFENREFTRTDYKGGNDVVYLAGFLQLLAPSISTRISDLARTAWDAASWGEIKEHPCDDKDDRLLIPDPLKCGLRTIEHLNYDNWTNLGFHRDDDSLFTVLIALSDPADYIGGDFAIQYRQKRSNSSNSSNSSNTSSTSNTSNTSKYRGRKWFEIKPERLSAVVFLSECEHGIRGVGSAGRVTFVSEFWELGDVAVGGRRPGPKEFAFWEETGVWNHSLDDDDGYGGNPDHADEDEQGNESQGESQVT